MTLPGGTDADKTTQTEQILEFFKQNAGKVIAPSEVARELDLNLQTVTTIINRLALNNSLSKESRGSYMYSNQITDEDLYRMFRSLFCTVSEGIGSRVVQNVSGYCIEDIAEKPLDEAFPSFCNSLGKLIGKDMIDNMLFATASWEFGEKESSSKLQATREFLQANGREE